MTEPCEFCGGAVGQYPHGCPGCSAPQCCQRCCNGGSPSLLEQFRRMRADLDHTKEDRDELIRAADTWHDEVRRLRGVLKAEVERRGRMRGSRLRRRRKMGR